MLWEETIPLMNQGYHKKLVEKAYRHESNREKVFPPRELVFNAMRITSFDGLRVVIIGQDPYFNEHPKLGPEAHGLCFSVKEGIPHPPSLRNIFKEVNETVYQGRKQTMSSDLTRWAKQGVLLLNASLSVISGKPNSHSNLGWHELTDNIIETIANKKEHIVFMLWGAFAQKKEKLINHSKHLVLKTSHPSPLSAYRGFLGSQVFVQCNRYLMEHRSSPVEW